MRKIGVALILSINAIIILNVWSVMVSPRFVSIFAFSIFLFLCWIALKNYSHLIVLLLPLLFLRLTEFISFVVIEQGAFMTETLRTGTASGGGARYLVVVLVASAAASVVIQPTWNRVQSKIMNLGEMRHTVASHFIFNSFAMMLGLVCAYLILIGVRFGFPLLTGTERYAFRAFVSDSVLSGAINYATSISLMLGYFSVFSSFKKISIWIFSVFFILLILFGEKQTALSLNLLCFAMTPALVRLAKQEKLPLMALLRLFGLISAVTVPAVLISYGVSANSEMAWSRFFSRIALQGQLWHLADLQAISAPIRFDLKTFSSEFNDLLQLKFRPAPDVGFEYGLYAVMRKFAESTVLSNYLTDRIGFIMALYPAWLTQYGWFALLVLSALGGVFWGAVASCLLLVLARGAHIALPFVALLVTMHLAAQVDGMSYRIFGLQVVLLLSVARMLSSISLMRFVQVKEVKI